MSWDNVAICVEPESRKGEWIALEGLLSVTYNLGIMVYVRDDAPDTEGLPLRVCNAYADAIYRLLIGNIHLDLVVDEVPLVADAERGDTSVFIGGDIADAWPPDTDCRNYEVQDNYYAEINLSIVDAYDTSSSSSGSVLSVSSESSSTDETSQSSMTISSQSSSFSSSLTSSSSSISSSMSSSYSTGSSGSSSSSTSSMGGPLFEIHLDRPLTANFRVEDKAVLRRKSRYFYDSQPESVEYGTVNKQSAFLKAAKISWWGKETHTIPLPQIGKGGQVY